MPLRAEQLPPEIWLYIFKYFEGHDLVRAFSGLNSFFNSLLRSPHLQLCIRIKQNESNEQLPDSIWSHINRENIYSLVVGRRKANCLIQFLRWHAQYLTHLSFLSMYLRKKNVYSNMQFLIHAFGELPSLKRLRIKYSTKLDSSTDDLDLLLTNIFNGRFNIQNYSFISDLSRYTMETSTWLMNPFLKHLHIENISYSNLFCLLSYTSELHSLQIGMATLNTDIQQNIILTQLEKINLNINSVPFIQLQKIREAAPNLKNLRLTGVVNIEHDDYLKENLWHQLLDNIIHYYVNLSASVYSEQRVTTIKSYIQNLTQNNWLSFIDNVYGKRIRIQFQSPSIK